jgi:hypothetical protein
VEKGRSGEQGRWRNRKTSACSSRMRLTRDIESTPFEISGVPGIARDGWQRLTIVGLKIEVPGTRKDPPYPHEALEVGAVGASHKEQSSHILATESDTQVKET